MNKQKEQKFERVVESNGNGWFLLFQFILVLFLLVVCIFIIHFEKITFLDFIIILLTGAFFYIAAEYFIEYLESRKVYWRKKNE